MYTDQRHEIGAQYFEPISDRSVKLGDASDTISQSVGVLFEEDNKSHLERIEFLSRWSGNSIEARISGKTSRFIVALEFSPRDLDWLSKQDGRFPSSTEQMSTSVNVVTDLIADKATQQLLSDGLSGTKFLILDPRRQGFDHRLFSVEAPSAKERAVAIIIFSRSGEILASTPITMYLPE